jgi:CHAD domain-containing protein
MDNFDLYKHFKAILKKARKNAKTALEKPGEEDLHQLRLSLKRLRAFYRFLESADKDFIYKAYFKPWKKYFKYYGDIRNRQVMEKLAKEKIDNLGLHIQVKPHAIKGSAPAPVKKKFIKKFRKVIKSTLAGLHKKQLKKYLLHELFRINGILKLTDAERYKQLHNLRKILKDLYYNKEFLNGYIDRMSFTAWLEEIMKYLGEWLDTSMLIQNLESGNELVFTAHDQAETELLKNELASADEKQRIIIMAMCNRGQLLIEQVLRT